MTSPTALARSLEMMGRWWLHGVAALLFTVAATAAALLFVRAPAAASETVQVGLPPAEAAALVEQTSAAVSQVRATGTEAQLINAALPFSKAPIEAARAFASSGDGMDHRRALLCLTQAVYYEAGFEPIEGRRAVAQVVLNRMHHPAFPKSVCGVVYQGSNSPVCQFSFVCDGSLYRAPAAGAWKTAKEIAGAALAGHVERSVGQATHYHADYVAPYWAPKLAKVEKIGAHIFYRWPGAWGRRAAFTGRYIGEPRDPLALRPPPRSDAIADGDEALTVDAAIAGPPVPRAANDVGGLLDTSKGWTLNIPAPGEIERESARAVAAQEKRPAPPSAIVASAAAPVAVAQ